MAYQSTHTGAQVDEAIDKALSADAVPTPGSTNLVQSGGVFAALSNRNLIANPWFTVNQRGFTSTSTNNTWTADRWLAQGLRTNGVISLSNAIITIDATNAVGGAVTFGQAVDEAEVGQRPVTLSVMLANGDIISDTATIPARTESQQTVIEKLIGTTQCYMRLYLRETSAATPYFVQFLAPIGATLAIKAVKLELGSVSTLANDAPPNYAEELAKCQRYFVRVPIVINRPYASGVATSAAGTQIRAVLPLPATMRTNPTATLTGTSMKAVGNAQSLAVSAVSADSIVPGGVILLLTVSGAVQNQCYSMVGAGDATLDFSADL